MRSDPASEGQKLQAARLWTSEPAGAVLADRYVRGTHEFYREVEVTRLVEQGLRNRDIARSLGIQTGTVKIHLKHIFEKTGIHGRFGLALSALKQKGLLAVPVLHHPEL